jgi:hypothetical protein
MWRQKKWWRGEEGAKVEGGQKKSSWVKPEFEIQSAQVHIIRGVCRQDRIPELQFTTDSNISVGMLLHGNDIILTYLLNDK